MELMKLCWNWIVGKVDKEMEKEMSISCSSPDDIILDDDSYDREPRTRLEILKLIEGSEIREAEKDRLKNGLGRYYDGGADGDVFGFEEEISLSPRVIKFCERGTSSYGQMRKIYESLMSNPRSGVVRVMEHGQLDGDNWYVVMEKLSPLSREDRNRLNQLVTYGPKYVIGGGGGTYDEIRRLAESLVLLEAEEDLVHGDLHHNNIMRSSSNELKVIDLDGFCYYA